MSDGRPLSQGVCPPLRKYSFLACLNVLCVDHSSSYAAQLAIMIFEGCLDSGAAADSGPDGPIPFSSFAV